MSKIGVTLDGQSFVVELSAHPSETELQVMVNGEPMRVSVPGVESSDDMAWIVVQGQPYEITIDRHLAWIKSYLGRHVVEVRDMEATTLRPISGDGRVKAPVPGLITRVLAQPGQTVEAGQPLLILEAMKMENQVIASRSGTLETLNVSAGQTVQLGAVLAEIV